MASLRSAYPELSPDFVLRAARVARRLGIDPWHLMAVMDHETGGTFSADTRYGGYDWGAVGLVQFTESTARDVLGTTKEELASMSATEQLLEVERYLSSTIDWAGTPQGLSDTYSLVLAPAYVGDPESEPMYVQGVDGDKYTDNASLDTNGNGTITKAEAAAPVRRLVRGSGPVSVEDESKEPLISDSGLPSTINNLTGGGGGGGTGNSGFLGGLFDDLNFGGGESRAGGAASSPAPPPSSSVPPPPRSLPPAQGGSEAYPLDGGSGVGARRGKTPTDPWMFAFAGVAGVGVLAYGFSQSD